MEIFFELILTVGLTLILNSFFIKLISMQRPSNTDKDRLTEEAQKIDKFHYMPFKEEVIKLEEFPSENKSSEELYNVVRGVIMEDCKFLDVGVVDSKEGVTEDFGEDDGKRFGSDYVKGGGGKLFEIENESEEENEEEIGTMDDWEEIGRKDFEELLGNKAALYNVDVGVDYGK